MRNDNVVCRKGLAGLLTVILISSVGCGGYSNGGGGGSNAHHTYVYAAQAGPLNGIGSFAQFELTENGTLSPLTPGSVPAKGASDDFASSVVVSSSSTYLYAENTDSQTISQYSITGNGTLAFSSTFNFEFFSMAFAHNGQLAVVANTAGLNSYAVSAAGTMSLVSTAPMLWGGGAVVIDPSEQFVYVVDESESKIIEYALSAAGQLAALTPSNTVATAWLPFTGMFSPKGIFYSVDYGAGTITQYSMNGTTGALMAVQSFSTGAPAGSIGPQPRWISFDPTGSFAYVGNVYNNTISQFIVDSTTGALIRNGADIPTSWGPLQVVVDPSGKYVFSADGDGEIMEFIINKDGTLTANGSVLLGNIDQGFPFGIMFAER